MRSRAIWPAALVLFVIVSRATSLSPFEDTNRDGPVYVNALKLDRTYDVPSTPGKLGFVLAAAALNRLGVDPLHAYGAVTIGLSATAALFFYLFATLYLPRGVAAAAAFAAMCGPIVWYYGSVIASYIVWLPCFPAIGYFGIRYVRERRPRLLLWACAALGVAIVLRGDMLLFAGPLIVGILVFGRAGFREWLIAAAVCAVCTAAWFFGTAPLVGGPAAYARAIAAQGIYHVDEGPWTYAPVALALRNIVKLAMFLLWNTHLLLIPAMMFLASGGWRGRRRGEIVVLALWILPTAGFSLAITMCTGGLIFAGLPLIAVAAGRGLLAMGAGRRTAAMALAAAGAAFAIQYAATPLRSNRLQRDVIFNVMFAKAGRAAVQRGYFYNLDDFGIDSSLPNVLREIRLNEPVPLYPDDFRGPR